MIERDVALIVSGGRTGTSFLGRRASSLIDDCDSFHEPDVWYGAADPRSWRAVVAFGPYHAVLGKVLRRTGMLALSYRYCSGHWSAEKTAAAVIRQRKRFYGRSSAGLVLESNYQWFGLLPLLPRVFKSYRVLAIVRDPRSWVRSWLDYGGHHDETDMLVQYGGRRLSPEVVGEGHLFDWSRMDTFQRLCWDWAFVARQLMQAASTDPRIALVRFEDLFLAPDAERSMTRALEVIADFGDHRYVVKVPPGALQARVNASAATEPTAWHSWSASQRSFLLEVCGEAMAQLGYE